MHSPCLKLFCTPGPGRFHFRDQLKEMLLVSRTSERKVQRKQSKITRRFHPLVRLIPIKNNHGHSRGEINARSGCE